MPAYPNKYVKDEFEKGNARDVPYLIEEFHGTLTKLIPEYPKLKEVKKALNDIEAWEDI